MTACAGLKMKSVRRADRSSAPWRCLGRMELRLGHYSAQGMTGGGMKARRRPAKKAALPSGRACIGPPPLNVVVIAVFVE